MILSAIPICNPANQTKPLIPNEKIWLSQTKCIFLWKKNKMAVPRVITDNVHATHHTVALNYTNYISMILRFTYVMMIIPGQLQQPTIWYQNIDSHHSSNSIMSDIPVTYWTKWSCIKRHYELHHPVAYFMPQSHPTTGPARFLSPVRFLAHKAEGSARMNFTSVLFPWSHKAAFPICLDTSEYLWFGWIIRRTQTSAEPTWIEELR